MKNKKTIALIIGIACIMILSAALVWSALDNADKPSQEDDQAPIVEPNDQSEEKDDTVETPENQEPENQEPENQEPENETPQIDQTPDNDSSVDP